jgi:malic enzyme
VSNDMLVAAAHALAACTTDQQRAQGRLYPDIQVGAWVCHVLWCIDQDSGG